MGRGFFYFLIPVQIINGFGLTLWGDLFLDHMDLDLKGKKCGVLKNTFLSLKVMLLIIFLRMPLQ